MINMQKPQLKSTAIKEGWTSCFRCGGHGYAMLPNGGRETCHVCDGYGLSHPNDMQRFEYIQRAQFEETGKFDDAKIESLAQAELKKKRGRPVSNQLVGLDE